MSKATPTRARRRRMLVLVAAAAAVTVPTATASSAPAGSSTMTEIAPSSFLGARPLARNTGATTATVDWALGASGGTSSCPNVPNGCTVAVDGQGNVYVAAGFDGTETVPSALTVNGTRVSPASTTLPATTGAFVSKWSSAGVLLWTAPMTLNFESAVGVAVDATGSVFVTGSFGGTATISSAVLPGGAPVNADASIAATSLGNSDIFVAKWTGAGVLEWMAQSGGANVDSGGDVAVDATGSVNVTGNFDGVATTGFFSATTAAGVAVDTDASVAATAGGGQLFVAQWSNDGTLAWMAAANANNGQQSLGIATDASGSVFATGYISGAGAVASATNSAGADVVPSTRLSFNTGPALDMFIAKWNSAGSLLWIVQAGSAGASADVGFDIAIDPTGSAYVTGYFDNTAVFPSATNAAGNAVAAGASVSARITGPGFDTFVGKWADDGTLAWLAQIGGNGSVVGTAVAIDAAGAAIVGGTFRATTSATFASATTSAGAPVSAASVRASTGELSDAFIAEWSTDGAIRWIGQVGGAGNDVGEGVAVDRSGTASDGALYATGSFTSPSTVFSATAAALGVAPSASIPLSANNADSHMFLARWNSRDFVPPAPGGGGAPPSIPSITPPGATTGTSGGFEPLTPQRVLDTRGSGPVAAGSITRVDLDNVLAGRRRDETRSSRGADTAVVVNVTAVGARAPGYLTVFACDTPLPNVSNLNYPTGGTIANTVVSGLSPSGELCVFSSTSTNLLVDVNGWFSSGFTPVRPVRLLDTRRSAALAPESITRISLGAVPNGARGAVLNITAVDPARAGYLSVFDCSSVTGTSTVNAATNTIANLAVTGISSTGEICIFSSMPTQVLVDLFGWFDQVFNPIATRLLDTRTTGQASARSVLRIPVTGRAGIPTDIGSASITVTVVNARQSGYATVYPCAATPPNTSSINYAPGDTIAVSTISGLDSSGMVCVYTSADADYLIDITGWYRS